MNKLDIITAKELSNELSVSIFTVYKWSSQAKLPKLKYSGKLAFLRSDVNEFIMQNRVDCSQKNLGGRA